MGIYAICCQQLCMAAYLCNPTLLKHNNTVGMFNRRQSMRNNQCCSIFHQRIAVGDLCMIGMNETVTRHVPPFAVLADGRFLKINTRGLSLNGRTQAEIREIENRYRRGTSNDPANADQLIIDAFLATQTKGGVYRYEKAQPSPSSIPTLTPPQ